MTIIDSPPAPLTAAQRYQARVEQALADCGIRPEHLAPGKRLSPVQKQSIYEAYLRARSWAYHSLHNFEQAIGGHKVY
jgi:hypothetical protein